MRLLNPTTKNIIELKKVIYENELSGVSCAIAEDSEWGKCFVKILHYGQMGSIQEQKNALFRAKEEANCMKLVSQCTKQSPRLYDSWEDRTQKQSFTGRGVKAGCGVLVENSCRGIRGWAGPLQSSYF